MTCLLARTSCCRSAGMRVVALGAGAAASAAHSWPWSLRSSPGMSSWPSLKAAEHNEGAGCGQVSWGQIYPVTGRWTGGAARSIYSQLRRSGRACTQHHAGISPHPLPSSSPAPSSTLRAVATAGCCWMTATRLVRVLPSTVLVESVSPDEVLVALPPTATTPVCGGGGSRWVRGCEWAGRLGRGQPGGEPWW